MKVGNGPLYIEVTPEDKGFLPKRFLSFLNRRFLSKKYFFKLKELLELDIEENGHRYFSQNKTYKTNKEITLFLVSLFPFLKKGIKKCFIEEYKVENYNQSDVFVAAMILLADYLNSKDIEMIYQKPEGCGDNPQFARYYFLEQIISIGKVHIPDYILKDYEQQLKV